MKRWMLPGVIVLVLVLATGIFFLFRPVELEREEPEEERELPRREVEEFQISLPPQEDGFGLELEGDLLVESPDGSHMDLTRVWGEILGPDSEKAYEVEARYGYLEMDPEYLRLEEEVKVKGPFYTLEMGILEWYGGDPTLYGSGGVFIEGEGFSGRGEKVELQEDMGFLSLKGDARLYIKGEGDGVETP